MHVVFVNRFYWPETPATGQLLTDLAEHLAARGFAIEIVTSRDRATTPARETHRDVRIHRVRGTRLAARLGALGKALDFATFYALALWRTSRVARRSGVVVAMTDPPLLGIGLGLVARARGARVVHWVQDIYPEIAIVLARATLLRALIPLRNRAWRAADACVTLGRDMARRIEQAGVTKSRIHVVSNWHLAGAAATAADVAELRRAWNLEGRFVLLYSGNLGRVHDLGSVIELAAALRDDARFAVVFVGHGAQLDALKATCRDRALANVHFYPPQPRARLAATLALADVHLVTLRPDCADLVFPSKLYGATAAARTIAFIGAPACEVAELVVRNRLGFVAAPESIADLALRLRRLADEPSARAEFERRAAEFAQRHDIVAAAESWSRLLAALDATPAAATVVDRAAS